MFPPSTTPSHPSLDVPSPPPLLATLATPPQAVVTLPTPVVNSESVSAISASSSPEPQTRCTRHARVLALDRQSFAPRYTRFRPSNPRKPRAPPRARPAAITNLLIATPVRPPTRGPLAAPGPRIRSTPRRIRDLTASTETDASSVPTSRRSTRRAGFDFCATRVTAASTRSPESSPLSRA